MNTVTERRRVKKKKKEEEEVHTSVSVLVYVQLHPAAQLTEYINIGSE